MSDLATWYSAQLDDDEQLAQAATPGPWMALDGGVRDLEEPAAWPVSCTESEREGPDRDHIARHHPEQVLADIAAKRRIVEFYQRSVKFTGCGLVGLDGGVFLALDEVVHLLAAAMSDRPGWDPAWKPREES